MGLFGDLIGATFGGGFGGAGANNAHLAELEIRKLSDNDKKRVAEKVIEMGVIASGNRQNAEQYCLYFNRKERICQLNVIALALVQLNIHPENGASWVEVRNPYTLNIDSTDIKVNAAYLFKKYSLKVSIGAEQIDIRKWAS